MAKDYRLITWMKDNLPEGKETFSRDAVEILMGLLWEEAKRAEKANQAAREHDDRYGDY